MKLAALYLDDVVVIPAGRETGPGTYTDLRDSSFQASDGWDLRETLPGTFSLHREGMPAPVTVGGYGYAYVRAEAQSFEERHRAELEDVLSEPTAAARDARLREFERTPSPTAAALGAVEVQRKKGKR